MKGESTAAAQQRPAGWCAYLEGLLRTFLYRIVVIVSFLALFWVLALLDGATHGKLSENGIRPHQWPEGFTGILVASFLHDGCCGHVASNTLPFFVCGLMVIITTNIATFLLVTASIALGGGFMVYTIGKPNSCHVGASTLVFGYCGFTLTSALLGRNWKQLAASVVVLVSYGGALAGMFPHSTKISWEGHLCGFLVGIGCGIVSSVVDCYRSDAKKEAAAQNLSVGPLVISSTTGAKGARVPAAPPAALAGGRQAASRSFRSFGGADDALFGPSIDYNQGEPGVEPEGETAGLLSGPAGNERGCFGQHTMRTI